MSSIRWTGLFLEWNGDQRRFWTRKRECKEYTRVPQWRSLKRSEKNNKIYTDTYSPKNFVIERRRAYWKANIVADRPNQLIIISKKGARTQPQDCKRPMRAPVFVFCFGLETLSLERIMVNGIIPPDPIPEMIRKKPNISGMDNEQQGKEQVLAIKKVNKRKIPA